MVDSIRGDSLDLHVGELFCEFLLDARQLFIVASVKENIEAFSAELPGGLEAYPISRPCDERVCFAIGQQVSMQRRLADEVEVDEACEAID